MHCIGIQQAEEAWRGNYEHEFWKQTFIQTYCLFPCWLGVKMPGFVSWLHHLLAV